MQKISEEHNDILVSVIIPTYNSSHYIRDAIESVLKQSVTYEIIVVDDASRDDTYRVIETYIQNKTIRYIQNEKNQGVAEARNTGVSYATGRYIAFLDADDWWAPEKLSKQIRFMENHRLRMSGTARYLVEETGRVRGQVIHIPDQIEYNDLLHHNSLACSSVMVDRELALKYRMEHSEVHEDYLTWLRMLQECKVAGGIDEPLLYYRLSSTGKSRNKIKSAKMTYGVYRILGYGPVHSLCYLVAHLSHGVHKYWNIAHK